MKQLILGGARSGKSRLAEQRAAASGLAVTYVATATALDAEMRQRIDRHRQRRPAHWQLCEEPLALGQRLAVIAQAGRCVLIDCLTLWLSNLLVAGEQDPGSERQNLLDALVEAPGQVILVSNEVGQGIVPDNPLAREFRDQAGLLHQAVAAVCDRVTLVVAGLPLELKGGQQ